MARELVLLHGFTHTGASWDPVRAALGERYRAVAPDIRGHGVASDLEPVTLNAAVSDVGGLAPDRFTLAGYSMGGRIALHVALALPERVERLVLVGASPGIADPLERVGRQATDDALADRLQTMSIEDFAEEWARTPVLTGLPTDVAARVHEDRLRNTPSGLARALRGLGTGALPPLWDRLSELSMPVVCVAGERDEKFTAIADSMSEAPPDAGVVIVPGAGHAVHLEDPVAVANVIAG